MDNAGKTQTPTKPTTPIEISFKNEMEEREARYSDNEEIPTPRDRSVEIDRQGTVTRSQHQDISYR
eukprot:768404-Hanusia_phi.AAC.4